MYEYRIYGMRVVSDREIIQLLTESKALEIDAKEGVNNAKLPILTIKEGFPESLKEQCVPGHYWDIRDNTGWLHNSTCWLNVNNGSEILYSLKPGAEDAKLNSYLLGFGMSMVALQRDYLPVHSSGLMYGDNAIMISGNSGAGKSTLTASYIENGYDLMADDITLVKKNDNGEPMAYSGFPYQKLCRNEVEKRHAGEDGLIYIDEERDKFLVPWRGRFSPNPKPLRALVFIEPVEDIDELEITELKGFDKMRLMPLCMYMRRILGEYMTTPRVVTQQMWLASKLPIVYVKRPVNKDTIDEIFIKTNEIVKKYFK